MTPEESQQRVAAIEKLQSGFDNRLATLDRDLLADLLGAADKILASPKALIPLLGKFENRDYASVLTRFGTDLLIIKNLNDGYFEGAIGDTMSGQYVNDVLFENVQQRVERLYVERFGIRPDGEVVSDGLFDLFSRDTTVRRQIQQFAYAQKSSGIGVERFKRNLRAFVTGDADGTVRGVYSRHYNAVAYDTYQQADRVMQQEFSAGLNMDAFLYLGGTIAGTRPFCRARDGKVFLRSEIARFGTASDVYGGYENKAAGYFSGKPKSGYAPFTDAGGFFCRHHFSAISDREALRRRDDIEKKPNGTLVVQ